MWDRCLGQTWNHIEGNASSTSPNLKSPFGWSLLLRALRETYLALSRKWITSLKREGTQTQWIHQSAKIDLPQQRHPRGQMRDKWPHLEEEHQCDVNGHPSQSRFTPRWREEGWHGQSTHWVWCFSSGNGEQVFRPLDATRKILWSETKTLSGWFSFRKKKMIGSHADKQQLWQERQKNVGVYVGVPCQGFSCEVRCV